MDVAEKAGQSRPPLEFAEVINCTVYADIWLVQSLGERLYARTTQIEDY